MTLEDAICGLVAVALAVVAYWYDTRHPPNGDE